MDTQLLQRKFEALGARVRIATAPQPNRVRVDIKSDRKGEYFDLTLSPADPLRVDVLDCQPRARHLLLMVAPEAVGAAARGTKVPFDQKQKFLCGHDERTWFVAAVPESSGASNVRTAMEALKPWAARASQDRHAVRFENRNRRKNPGFVRQGEWFFIPRPDVTVPAAWVTQRERIQRSGGGKPHWAEFASRSGGEGVYVEAGGGRRILAESQFRNLAHRNPAAARKFSLQRRNATLLVKGRISHPDHATILLRCWHEVAMNTENQSVAMRSVAFID